MSSSQPLAKSAIGFATWLSVRTANVKFSESPPPGISRMPSESASAYPASSRIWFAFSRSKRVLLLDGDVGEPGRVGRRAERERRSADARVDLVDDRLLVDRVPIACRTRRSRSAGCGFFRPAPPLIAISSTSPCSPSTATMPSVWREPLEGRRRDVERRVDLALLQRGDHRVRVVEDAEDRPRRTSAAPPSSSRSPTCRQNWPGSCSVRMNGPEPTPSRPSVLGDLVRAVLVPDVLREQVEIHRRELRIGHARRDLDRALVDRARLQILHGRVLVQPLLVTRALDVHATSSEVSGCPSDHTSPSRSVYV